MDKTEDDILSRLKFIGKIQKGEKINVKNMIVQQNGLLTRISRSFFNIDSRENALNFIIITIKRSFELLSLHMTGKTTFDRTMKTNIISDLEKSKSGLNNLKTTYVSDVMFCCKIDTIVQEIEARLEELTDPSAIKDYGSLVNLEDIKEPPPAKTEKPPKNPKN